MNTNNLAEFGNRELAIAGELLTAYAENRPANFYEGGVKLEFNPGSGNVFLVNDDGQVLVLDGDELREWHFLSYAGNEGFADGLFIEFRDGGINENDYEQLADILEAEGMKAEAEEVRRKITEE